MSNMLVPRSDVGEFRRRYRWLSLFAVLALFAVMIRLFHLQVVKGSDYAQTAHENIIRRVTMPTTRGVVRDSQGRVLASSRPSYNVYIVPGRVMPSARPPKRRRLHRDDPDTFGRIADTLRLNPEERARITTRIREACVTDDDKSPCWHRVLVREDLSRDIVAELKQHETETSGAEVVQVPVRYYPYKGLGAHMLGYVAEIDAETLGKFRPPGYEQMSPDERQKVNPLAYDVGDSIGAVGLERVGGGDVARGRVLEAHRLARDLVPGAEVAREVDAGNGLQFFAHRWILSPWNAETRAFSRRRAPPPRSRRRRSCACPSSPRTRAWPPRDRRR